MNKSETKTCPICSGKLKKEKINYETYVNGKEFIIKNIWANQCENCGEDYFNTKTAMEIEETIEFMKTETRDESIDLFLKTLGDYWKANKELSFSDIVKMLERKYKLHKLDLGAGHLTFILDRLILETSYPELREKISKVYSKELESLKRETDKKDLISTILKWYLSGEAYIESAGMKLMVSGYIRGIEIGRKEGRNVAKNFLK